jgi:hypothetical protein
VLHIAHCSVGLERIHVINSILNRDSVAQMQLQNAVTGVTQQLRIDHVCSVSAVAAMLSCRVTVVT